MRISASLFQAIAPSSLGGFLVLEGVNGGGKSTLQRAIGSYLAKAGRAHLLTREPGATPLGERLRSLILSHEAGAPAPLTELILFAADRAEHVQKKVLPALQRKELVISDRYFYSTIAFQGHGRGLPLPTINTLNEIAVAGLYPDIVLLLDLPVEEGLRRAGARGGARDSFEEEKIAFHQRLRQGFLELAEKRPEPFLVLDATQSPETIFSEVQPILDRYLSLS